MLRSGFLLGVSGSAAVLSLLVLPAVRHGADAWAAPVAFQAPNEAPAVSIRPTDAALPGLRPVSLRISPVRSTPVEVASAPRPEARPVPGPAASGSPLSQEMPAKPRRLTREGCETPISALAGPEARRMVPGRCMT